MEPKRSLTSLCAYTTNIITGNLFVLPCFACPTPTRRINQTLLHYAPSSQNASTAHWNPELGTYDSNTTVTWHSCAQVTGHQCNARTIRNGTPISTNFKSETEKTSSPQHCDLTPQQKTGQDEKKKNAHACKMHFYSKKTKMEKWEKWEKWADACCAPPRAHQTTNISGQTTLSAPFGRSNSQTVSHVSTTMKTNLYMTRALLSGLAQLPVSFRSIYMYMLRSILHVAFIVLITNNAKKKQRNCKKKKKKGCWGGNISTPTEKKKRKKNVYKHWYE